MLTCQAANWLWIGSDGLKGNPLSKGHEQQKRRPCVMVSPESMERIEMAVVCSMTTKLRPHWPFRLRVTCNGQANDIMVDQIRAVSLERFDAFIQVLRPNDIQHLKDMIARMYTV